MIISLCERGGRPVAVLERPLLKGRKLNIREDITQ